MAVFVAEMTTQEFANRRDEFKVKDEHELCFHYHGKLRVGRVEVMGDTYVVLALSTDGDVQYPRHQPQFKAFSFAKIEGEIEVYRLP